MVYGERGYRSLAITQMTTSIRARCICLHNDNYYVAKLCSSSHLTFERTFLRAIIYAVVAARANK